MYYRMMTHPLTAALSAVMCERLEAEAVGGVKTSHVDTDVVPLQGRREVEVLKNRKE